MPNILSDDFRCYNGDCFPYPFPHWIIIGDTPKKVSLQKITLNMSFVMTVGYMVIF
jgi:hypothetical protein